MSRFTVYGVREKGGKELRYIGQTGRELDVRLYGLRKQHGFFFDKEYRADAFGHWLDEYGSTVEIIALATFKTREEAISAERMMIGAFCAAGHRLFNRDHVPHHLRADGRVTARKIAA